MSRSMTDDSIFSRHWTNPYADGTGSSSSWRSSSNVCCFIASLEWFSRRIASIDSTIVYLVESDWKRGLPCKYHWVLQHIDVQSNVVNRPKSAVTNAISVILFPFVSLFPVFVVLSLIFLVKLHPMPAARKWPIPKRYGLYWAEKLRADICWERKYVCLVSVFRLPYAHYKSLCNVRRIRQRDNDNRDVHCKTI